jgi:hypothetical protein
MGVHKHLFLEVTEGWWTALGPAGEVPDGTALPDADEESGHELEPEEAPSDEQQTVCQSIEAELRMRGPSRISELIERAPDFLPLGRSVNSVGPVLITRKDIFARPLPGIYALHDQIPSPTNLLATPPAYLFQEDQVRLYARARRAGEPWGAYPLWLPETEYLWCTWARKHADTELFESLLSVAQIDDWPNVADREAWQALARNRGRFSIHFPPSSAALVVPDLNRLLAACLYIRQHGHISWISGNRILMRRAPEHGSAGLLAVLTSLGVLGPDAEDWQAPHKPGPRLNEQLTRLEAGRLQSGNLDWKSDLGRELEVEAVAAPAGGGWVSPELVQKLFEQGLTTTVRAARDLSPLDQLLAESAELKRSATLEETLRALAKRSGETEA